MKKFGTMALVALTAVTLTSVCVSCGEKKKETPKTNAPAEKPAEKPAGGH